MVKSNRQVNVENVTLEAIYPVSSKEYPYANQFGIPSLTFEKQTKTRLRIKVCYSLVIYISEIKCLLKHSLLYKTFTAKTEVSLVCQVYGWFYVGRLFYYKISLTD